jgi:hypothetical protein
MRTTNLSFRAAGRDSKSFYNSDGVYVAELLHMDSVEENIAVAIKLTIDFGWIGSSSSSLHGETVVDGIVRCITSTAIPW